MKWAIAGPFPRHEAHESEVDHPQKLASLEAHRRIVDAVPMYRMVSAAVFAVARHEMRGPKRILVPIDPPLCCKGHDQGHVVRKLFCFRQEHLIGEIFSGGTTPEEQRGNARVTTLAAVLIGLLPQMLVTEFDPTVPRKPPRSRALSEAFTVRAPVQLLVSTSLGSRTPNGPSSLKPSPFGALSLNRF